MLVDLSLPGNAAIHEYIALAAVAMHVTKEDDLIIPVARRDELFRKVDGRVEQARRIGPSSIEIAADHVAAIVADDDAIRVQHWDNLEDEGVPQQLSLSVILLK